MTTNFRIGTVDVPARIERERYFKELTFVELSVMFARAQKPSVLAKWAAVAPPGVIGLVAPFVLTHRRPPAQPDPWPHDQTTGEFRDSALGREALSALAGAAKILGASSVVFRSPEDFSPSAANRERLVRFFADVATEEHVGAPRVWLPGGLWEVRSAAKLAAELGVTLAFDPLVQDPNAPEERFEDLDASSLYFRIESAGRAGLIRNEKLEDLAALVEHYADHSTQLAIVFASPERWQDARNFKKLLELS
jgi:uncharacterized protein YecE (DUF72 family)